MVLQRVCRRVQCVMLCVQPAAAAAAIDGVLAHPDTVLAVSMHPTCHAGEGRCSL